MPRRSRLNVTGLPQHLIQRGNNRQVTFFAEEDYRAYIGWLVDATQKYDCRIYAYVLMTNHVHLLASTSKPMGLSLMMQYVGRHFVRHINRVYRRSGILWEGRFRASLVDTENYFLRCCRYIECNPVRAGMVEGPGEYHWSSYRSHAVGRPDPLVVSHEQYEQLGVSDEERQTTYRGLFHTELETKELAEIRDSTNRGYPLGSERFKDEIERTLQQAVRPPKRGRPPKTVKPVASERLGIYRV